MSAGVSPKEQLIQQLREIAEQLQSRLTENETNLKQNQLEVDRLRQRNVALQNQLNRLDETFDTIPRQDIKVIYEDAIKIKSRLGSMQGQLEKLQATQDNLTEFRETLQDILLNLEDVQIDRAVTAGGAASGGATGRQMSLAGEQIVRIVEAQESERQRLANALHDGPAQSLTNFILQAEICQRLFDRDPARASVELVNLKEGASVSFQKIREFIFDLRPMMLDDLGLIATVRRHVENLNEKADLTAKFQLTGTERRLPKHVEVIAFRGIQQLVASARNNLGSDNILVVLDVSSHQVRAVVEANGRGFDPDVALDRTQGDSPLQNLLDLRERVELVSGTLEIYSTEEQEGSRIEIILPYSE